MNAMRRIALGLLYYGGVTLAPSRVGHAQGMSHPSLPRLHHVGLNSVDPDRAIEWYLRVWPTAKRTVMAGYPAVEGDMLLLFNKVKLTLQNFSNSRGI